MCHPDPAKRERDLHLRFWKPQQKRAGSSGRPWLLILLRFLQAQTELLGQRMTAVHALCAKGMRIPLCPWQKMLRTYKSYDIFDETAGVVTANLDDASGLPNQIRKVSVSISCRSPLRGLFRRDFERITLTTSVTLRNLSFRDRYQ